MIFMQLQVGVTYEKKRSFILVALASISFTLAVPLTLNTTSSPITYAKSTKRIAGKTVAKAIKKRRI